MAKNHTFVGGNKRAAFLAVGLCLYVNGWRLVGPQAEATANMLALAAGELDEAAYAGWIRERLVRRAG